MTCDAELELCDVKCNLNPTNYINTAALVMWNVAGTHTRTKPMAHNFTHTGKVIRVQRRKGWVLWAELNTTENTIYLL